MTQTTVLVIALVITLVVAWVAAFGIKGNVNGR